MSKQLAISAAFSVFAMSAFLLLGTRGAASVGEFDMLAAGFKTTGAEAIASTPVIDHTGTRLVPDLES